jgi:hypothetical protein
MKRFIWLLILAAAGYGVWKYYPEVERQARRLTAPEETPAEETPGLETLPGGLPVVGAGGKRAAVAATAPVRDDELEARYPMPEFQPIEALVGAWKKIPASAFPRQVTLKAPATLKLTGGVGTSRLEAGRKVYALAGTPEGALVIAPSREAVMRGQVPMESTDFQDVLSEVYEDFKQRKRAEVESLRAAARREAAAGGPALGAVAGVDRSAPPAAALAAIGPKPASTSDATVPAVVESIAERQRAKKNAEPPAGTVLGWGPVRYREVDGEPYWSVSVSYKARTIFGEFPAEALALMRHGRVVKWVYAGTGEPLP